MSSSKEPASWGKKFDAEALRAAAEEDEDGFEMPVGSEQEIRAWLDCMWKRIPCGEDGCPICGRVNRERMRLFKEGENPDSIAGAIDSVGASLAESAILIVCE